MSTDNNYIPISEYYSNAIGKKIAENYNTYGVKSTTEGDGETSCGNCESACQNCEGYCSGTCKGVACQTTCTGSCSGGCKTGCYASCKADCSGTCVGNCTDSCSGTCTSGCETYCANDCQTYCEHEQIYSQNTGKNNPGGKIFTWDSSVFKWQTIYLSAEEWNRLASYVEAAMKYCATTSTKITRVNSKDPIYASYYNSMNIGVNTIGSSGESSKTSNVDFITASNINALKDGYNDAKILVTLPSNPTGAHRFYGSTCRYRYESGSLQPV